MTVDRSISTALDSRQPSRQRLDSVDLLRGLVMVIMALDHVRDYLTNLRFQPEDLDRTTPALFMTRWGTHFCAPTFMFLVGVGMSLAHQRGKTKPELARFLLTRGIWLIFLEFTVVNFGWAFNFNYSNGLLLLVLWALGMCMICLAGLIFLPRPAIAAIALGMIVAHNAFDSTQPPGSGILATLWSILHRFGPIAGGRIFVLYPLIPWIGVMAAGFLFCPIITADPRVRRSRLLVIGLSLTVAFVLLRTLNHYGDPNPWSKQKDATFTVLSFLNTTKYPPSLEFLLMTLGPAIASLALFDRADGPFARYFITIGRVPFFFYLLHIYLIHAVALLIGMIQGINIRAMISPFPEFPDKYGTGLPVIYAVWLGVVMILYRPCRWFAGVKQRSKTAWLSYL